MLTKTRRNIALLLAVIMIAAGMQFMNMLTVYADDEVPENWIEYDGEEVTFIKADGSAFGMWTPLEGSTAVFKDDEIQITIFPKNTTVYSWMHWGLIKDENLTHDVSLNDGKLEFTVDIDACGYGVPIAPVKPDGGTTGTQYYLAVPALNKFDADYSAVDDALDMIPEDLSAYTEESVNAVYAAQDKVERGLKADEQDKVDAMAQAIEEALDGLVREDGMIEYDGEVVTFIKADGSAFGMWAPQDGSTAVFKDDEIQISILPKNTTTYAGMHWGPIADEDLTIDVDLVEGKLEFTVETDVCGYGVPIAPVKPDGGTTGTQYYLAVPGLEYFDADYSAVDAALAKVPADLSIYTDESKQALEDAINAVERGLKADDQYLVDMMAWDIEDAIDELAIPYNGEDVTFVKIDGNAFGMWAPQEGSTAVFKDGEIQITILPKNTTTYSGMHWGPITDEELTMDVELEDEKLEFSVEADDAGTLIPIAPVKPDGTTTGTQYYLAVPGLEYFDADYDAVDEAIDSVPVDMSIFTEISRQAVEAAVAAVERGLKADEQDAVDAMAEAIEDAVAALEKLGADYSAVDAALATVPEDLSIYTEVSRKAVEDAVAAVDRNKSIDEQASVDAMAKAIKDAVAGLVEKLTVTNKSGMFVVADASLTEVNGQKYLVIVMNSTGYHYMFKGTYEDAVANGEATDKWISGTLNALNKWEFLVPLNEGETYMPLVAISQSYYEKYLNGQNPVERAFYPRQVKLDINAKTLETDDYNYTADLAVTNNKTGMKISSSKLYCVGGPNSNGYSATLFLKTTDSTFTEAFIGTPAEAKKSKETIVRDKDGLFSIPVRWMEKPGDLSTITDYANGKEFKLSLKNNKGTWVENTVKLSEEEKTFVITNKTNVAIDKVKAGKIKSFKVKAGKKKATFTWKKNTTFAGYQLKYKVGKKTKTINIKSAKTAKKVFKKLKKGQKVSGRIRGYKKISGKTYYGKWAKSKTVKVK